MARIRCIKPEFWTDEKLAECSLGARLLFIGTWNFADDEGRMEYSPKRLKMQVFPGDDIDVAPLVEELTKHKLVIVYRVESRDYLAIPNFSKHQRVDHPRPSAIPAPSHAVSHNPTGTVCESSPKPLRTLAPEGKGMEEKGIHIPPEPKSSSGSDSPSRKQKPTKTTLPASFGISDAVREWAEANGHTRLEERLVHFVGYAKANGKTYADWDQAFKNAIREDWARLNSDGRNGNRGTASADIFTNNPATRAMAALREGA